MARVAVSITCTDKDRRELERMRGSRTYEARMVERAKMVMGCLAGQRNDEIAAELGIRPGTVGVWRRRCAAEGLNGLRDRKRPGKPLRYSPIEWRHRLLAQIEQPPPAGPATWDGRSLSKALGVSDDAVWRRLRQEGIQLQRHRSWCVSTDPRFAVKSADMIGLYLNPPHHALVLAIDEKPSIQALERARGFVFTRSGKLVRGLKSTYKRPGTINLVSALTVATGTIQSKTTTTQQRPDFQAFLDEVVADVPADRGVHVILDNYGTHKKNDDWLAAHPKRALSLYAHFSQMAEPSGNLVWHHDPQDLTGGEFQQH